MLEAQGAIVVNYTYNAWGEIISITGTLADTIGQVNKFRYRSYYYDSETGFYYLQSRYYDPIVKRFISPDHADYLTENGDFDGYNLYAYCVNNPVMYVDDNGCYSVYHIVTGVIAGGLLAMLGDFWFQTCILRRSYTKLDKTSLFTAFVSGAIDGALSAIGANAKVGKTTRVLVKGVKSMFNSLYTGLKKSKIKSVKKALKVVGGSIKSGLISAGMEYISITYGRQIGYDNAKELYKQLLKNAASWIGGKVISIGFGFFKTKVKI